MFLCLFLCLQPLYTQIHFLISQIRYDIIVLLISPCAWYAYAVNLECTYLVLLS